MKSIGVVSTAEISIGNHRIVIHPDDVTMSPEILLRDGAISEVRLASFSGFVSLTFDLLLMLNINSPFVKYDGNY